MKTFKEFVSNSHKVAKAHRAEVNSLNRSTKNKIDSELDNKRDSFKQHLIQRDVNKKMSYTKEDKSEPDYHSIDVDFQDLHNHVIGKTPTASNIKTMHSMVHSFAKKHEMPVNDVYTLVKNNQQAHPAYQKEASK